MAAPHVSGVAGLMFSAGIDQRDVRDILHRTSMDHRGFGLQGTAGACFETFELIQVGI